MTTYPCQEVATCKRCAKTKNKMVEFYPRNPNFCRKCLNQQSVECRKRIYGNSNGQSWRATVGAFSKAVFGKREV